MGRSQYDKGKRSAPLILKKHISNKIAYFLIGSLIIVALATRVQPPPVKTMLYKGYVISLLSDGNIEALHTSDWKKDRKFSKALQQFEPEFLFSNSKTLAMINKEKSFTWSDEKFQWIEIGKLPHTEEPVLDGLVLNKRLFVIYPSEVVEPSGNRTYKIPIDHFPLRAAYAGKDKLWFGTGYGKAGGHLLILDIQSGEWNQIRHIDRYINSFTEDGSGTVWVVWVRNNLFDGKLDADSVLSSLSSDGIPRGYNGFLKDRYIQSIAFNKYDNHIYGIDRNYVVRFKPDITETIADLGNIRYLRDYYDEAGIIPAINDLLIVGRETFVIPHRIDGLFLCEKGNIRKIEESKSTAYGFKTRQAKLNRIYRKLKEGLGL